MFLNEGLSGQSRASGRVDFTVSQGLDFSPDSTQNSLEIIEIQQIIMILFVC